VSVGDCNRVPVRPVCLRFHTRRCFLACRCRPRSSRRSAARRLCPNPGLVGAFPVVGEDAAVTFGVINRGWESRLMLSWRALLDGRSRAELLSTVVGLGVRVLGAVAGRLLVVDVLLLGFVAAEVGL